MSPGPDDMLVLYSFIVIGIPVFAFLGPGAGAWWLVPELGMGFVLNRLDGRLPRSLMEAVMIVWSTAIILHAR